MEPKKNGHRLDKFGSNINRQKQFRIFPMFTLNLRFKLLKIKDVS
jgi:hypothetical protein